MALSYDQLQNATVQDLYNNPELLAAFNRPFAQPNPPSFFATNFDKKKQDLIDGFNLSTTDKELLDKFGNWNNPLNQADQQAAQKVRQDTLDRLNQESQMFAQAGIDYSSSPQYKAAIARLGGTGTSAVGGDTSQMDVANKEALASNKPIVPQVLSTSQSTTPAQPITTPTTAQTKPTGINLINSTLNYGSQGDQVKALQQYLSGLGYTGADGKPIKVDGVYGNDTKTAVMQFQSHNGLTQDGIFGPKSLAVTKNIASTATPAGTDTPAAQTFNTGDPAQDTLLTELQKYITDQQNAGLKINPALNFDQATLDKFLTTAQSQIHPYYAQQIDAIKQDVLKAAPEILQNYNNDVADKQSTFQNNLGTARENYAGSGLAFSGARGKGELGMQDTQNRDLTSLSQTYSDKLYDLGRTAEQKIGSSATPSLGSLTNYSADLSGNGGFNTSGITSPYTPGGYQIGSLTNEEAAATEARNQALKTAASNSVVAGRSYQDLFA